MDLLFIDYIFEPNITLPSLALFLDSLPPLPTLIWIFQINLLIGLGKVFIYNIFDRFNELGFVVYLLVLLNPATLFCHCLNFCCSLAIKVKMKSKVRHMTTQGLYLHHRKARKLHPFLFASI